MKGPHRSFYVEPSERYENQTLEELHKYRSAQVEELAKLLTKRERELGLLEGENAELKGMLAKLRTEIEWIVADRDRLLMEVVDLKRKAESPKPHRRMRPATLRKIEDAIANNPPGTKREVLALDAGVAPSTIQDYFKIYGRP